MIRGNTMEITIETETLQAMLILAAKKDVRYYLQGVLLETGPKGARLVSTDGHLMGVYKIEGDFPVSSGILPADFITTVCKLAGKQSKVYLKVTPGDIPVYSTLGFSMPGIDAKYPDWQRMLPRETVSGIAGQFDPDLLVRFKKAGKLFGRENPIVSIGYAGPGSAALVDVGVDNFIGLVMPVRADNAPTDSPAWALESLTDEVKAA